MSRRSAYLGDYGLPVGGASRGGRPKKKFEVKKSPARRKAEADLKKAQTSRSRAKAAKAALEKKQKSKTKPIKRGEFDRANESDRRAQGGRSGFTPRSFEEGLKRASADHRQALRDDAAYRNKLRRGKGRKMKADGTPSYQAPTNKAQEAGKRVIKARKTLAKTPKQGGAYRTGSSRNRYMVNPGDSKK